MSLCGGLDFSHPFTKGLSMNPPQQDPIDPVPFMVVVGVVLTIYVAFRVVTDKAHPARAAWIAAGQFGLTLGLSIGLMLLVTQAHRFHTLPKGSLLKTVLQSAYAVVSFAMAEMLISHWAVKLKKSVNSSRSASISPTDASGAK